MKRLPDTFTLGPEDETERLWNGALEASRKADGSLIALCEAIDLGIRAVEIRILQRLRAVRDRLPATIGSQLETPPPEVVPARDAVTPPHTLQLTDFLDLLSERTLDCVSPRLHHGWEDRRFSCMRSRNTAQEAVGLVLNGPLRNRLLLLSAYRNRFFLHPPPIRVVTAEVLDGFAALKELMELLEEAERRETSPLA